MCCWSNACFMNRYVLWIAYTPNNDVHLSRYTCLICFILYTVSHKKRATLFLIITLAFLGRFLYFLHQWKDEGILYTGVNKIYHFTPTVSPHYLVKLKRHKQHIFKSIITVRLIEPVVSNLRRNCPMFFFSNSW